MGGMDSACGRRSRILEAATELFQHYGFAKTTVADIARQAGVGVGSVYLEFNGKDAIMEALSSHRYEAVLKAMGAAVQAGAAFGERLSGAMDARAETFLAMAGGGTHASDLFFCHCSGTEAAHRRYLDAEGALLTALLEEGIRGGVCGVTDPQRAAATLQAAYRLTAPPFLFKRPADETRELLRGLHTLVVYGLLTR